MNGVEFMTSWLTPTVLFCVLNLMIGTIFITSSLKPQQNQQNFGDNEDSQPPQLARAPSFLERVKSINLSRYRFEQTEPVHYAVPAEEPQQQQRNIGDNEDSRPPQLVRVPSFLERVKSINLSKYWFEQTEPFHYAVSAEEPQQKQRNIGDNENSQPPQLARVPSFLERVKSINLSRYWSEQTELVHYAVPAEEQAAHQVDHEHESEESHHVTRSKSDTAAKVRPAAAGMVLKKSASEKAVPAEKIEEEEDQRRPATVRERTEAFKEEDEAVDARADDFINRFRQQLKLQRLDSILRYKEMLNRGTSS